MIKRDKYLRQLEASRRNGFPSDLSEMEAFHEYMQYGGMPLAVLKEGEEKKAILRFYNMISEHFFEGGYIMKKRSLVLGLALLLALSAGCGKTQKKENAQASISGDASADVYAVWAEDVKDLPECDSFSAADDEYSADVVFAAKEKVSDFKIFSLTIKDIKEDGTLDYDTEVLYTADELKPERPLSVKMSFPGDLPNYAISYKAADGTNITMGVSMSGKDGSVVLGEL